MVSVLKLVLLAPTQMGTGRGEDATQHLLLGAGNGIWKILILGKGGDKEILKKKSLICVSSPRGAQNLEVKRTTKNKNPMRLWGVALKAR